MYLCTCYMFMCLREGKTEREERKIIRLPVPSIQTKALGIQGLKESRGTLLLSSLQTKDF